MEVRIPDYEAVLMASPDQNNLSYGPLIQLRLLEMGYTGYWFLGERRRDFRRCEEVFEIETT